VWAIATLAWRKMVCIGGAPLACGENEQRASVAKAFAHQTTAAQMTFDRSQIYISDWWMARWKESNTLMPG
jgi:hypothetical protein